MTASRQRYCPVAGSVRSWVLANGNESSCLQDSSGNAQDYSVNPQDAAFFTLDGVVTLCDAGLASFSAPFNLSAPGPHVLQVPCQVGKEDRHPGTRQNACPRARRAVPNWHDCCRGRALMVVAGISLRSASEGYPSPVPGTGRV